MDLKIFYQRCRRGIFDAGRFIACLKNVLDCFEHPAVAESAVVSSPDETRGEVVKAFVILAPGYQGSPELAKELQDYVKKVTAPYKYPARSSLSMHCQKRSAVKLEELNSGRRNGLTGRRNK